MSEAEDNLEALAALTDVELVTADIMSKCGGEGPVIIFQHMIEHELSKNLSIVQTEIERLRRSKKYKIMHHFGLGGRSASVAIMLTEQYVLDLQHKLRSSPMLCTRFSSWIREQTNISVSLNELHSTTGLTAEDVSVLCDLGFLRQRGDIADSQQAYWLSHPAVTYVAYHLASAERFILAAIKRTRFKEMNSKDFNILFAHHTASLSQPTTGSGADTNSSATTGGVTDEHGAHGADEPQPKKRKQSHSSISINALYSQRGKGAGESSKKQATSPLPPHYHFLDLLGRKVLTAVTSADNRSLLLRIAK
ncbi:hypothetical protein EON65_12805 [archaeon]|nr:MAG: hypothetical protein EON65_12805 [archaeon]